MAIPRTMALAWLKANISKAMLFFLHDLIVFKIQTCVPLLFAVTIINFSLVLVKVSPVAFVTVLHHRESALRRVARLLQPRQCGPLMQGHAKRKMSIWCIHSAFIC